MKRVFAAAVVAIALMGSAVTAAPHSFHYLPVADFEPSSILPAPPARGSIQEKAELGALHAMIAGAAPQRIEQARWDDAHETPALFDGTLGITLESLPLTWALLREVQEEGDAAASAAKAHFERTRPYGIDPTLPVCVASPIGKPAKPAKSYPSGHATLGFSTGFVLAHLLAGRASAILDRAADYGASREYCGVHFPSDVEASHVLGTLIAAKLMTQPAFHAKFDAAHAELVAAHVAGA
ncbi:phosphatase PAP2 family protein [Sphingomonas sp. TREG-RG-20F-R18-01]|uniref:phosphatase PAP2 family protein n=1 Tax=Sphingomonas sp. TREG-RG-20F-R18-01 TaxID=2914982 RepID=UPI001F564CD5|nr:phosphatase PAP2 family protein [Sphingomonas sp. TREG-RG-20F-R18-01]